MSELLEKMKAACWDDPKRAAFLKEANRRHDFLRQLQVNSAMDKIRYMKPGLYRYLGIRGKALPEIFLISENHRLWDSAPGGQECSPAGGPDSQMLWRFRRIA